MLCCDCPTSPIEPVASNAIAVDIAENHTKAKIRSELHEDVRPMFDRINNMKEYDILELQGESTLGATLRAIDEYVNDPKNKDSSHSGDFCKFLQGELTYTLLPEEFRKKNQHLGLDAYPSPITPKVTGIVKQVINYSAPFFDSSINHAKNINKIGYFSQFCNASPSNIVSQDLKLHGGVSGLSSCVFQDQTTKEFKSSWDLASERERPAILQKLKSATIGNKDEFISCLFPDDFKKIINPSSKSQEFLKIASFDYSIYSQIIDLFNNGILKKISEVSDDSIATWNGDLKELSINWTSFVDRNSSFYGMVFNCSVISHELAHAKYGSSKSYVSEYDSLCKTIKSSASDARKIGDSIFNIDSHVPTMGDFLVKNNEVNSFITQYNFLMSKLSESGSPDTIDIFLNYGEKMKFPLSILREIRSADLKGQLNKDQCGNVNANCLENKKYIGDFVMNKYKKYAIEQGLLKVIEKSHSLSAGVNNYKFNYKEYTNNLKKDVDFLDALIEVSKRIPYYWSLTIKDPGEDVIFDGVENATNGMSKRYSIKGIDIDIDWTVLCKKGQIENQCIKIKNPSAFNEKNSLLWNLSEDLYKSIPISDLLKNLDSSGFKKLPSQFWAAINSAALKHILSDQRIGSDLFDFKSKNLHIDKGNLNVIKPNVLADAIKQVPSIKNTFIQAWNILTKEQQQALMVAKIPDFNPPINVASADS